MQTIKFYDALLSEHFTDFIDCKNLLNSLPGNIDIVNLKMAYDEQLYLWIHHAGILGFKACWDHFNEPKEPNVLDLDPEEYLEEGRIRTFPIYQAAQQQINAIAPRLTAQHHHIIIDYYSYLQTCAPKIAHYKGFLLANEVLPHIIPTFVKDTAYTEKYRQFLINWCGNSSFLE